MSGVYPPDVEIQRGAHLSDCGTYRYRLTRRWDTAVPPLPFIMLNPASTRYSPWKTVASYTTSGSPTPASRGTR